MPINRNTPLVALLLAASLAFAGNIAADTPPESPRMSTSTINGEPIASETTPTPTIQQSRLNAERRNILHHDHGLWIYNLLVNLQVDDDYDGHYSTFSVTLDVENSFNPRDVYAVFYLSQNNGPWFEYAVTGNFTVSGNGSGDSVSVVTSLDSGYASDYYDLSAEVYDAYTGALLLTFGPGDSSHVTSIPFESLFDDSHHGNNYYGNDHHGNSYGSEVSLQFSVSGAGALSHNTLLLFLLIFAARVFKATRSRAS